MENWIPIKERKNILGLIKDKKSPAQSLIEKYNTRWKQDIFKIFDEEAF